MTTKNIEAFAQPGTLTNPFPGLRPFEYDESHLFFGRDGQSEQLITKLARTRFLAVVGTSGSGKSSLVRAGLLPALDGGFMTSAGANWCIAILRPGNDPIGNLATSLNRPDVFGSDDEQNRQLQTAITEATLRRGSRGLSEAVRQAGLSTGENLLVVVDQFEELFRFARVAVGEEFQNEAAAFVKLLLEAPRQTELAIYVVLTMRSDFLGDCAQFWGLPEAINESQYLIPRLTRDQLREAITGPAAVGGGQMTARLESRLLNDVGDNPDQLPILQHALLRTWDEWQRKTPAHEAVHEGGAIDLCCYEAIGELNDALSRHADEAYHELSAPRQKLAEQIFKALTEKGEDNREVRRPLTVAALRAVTAADESDINHVIETFRRPSRSFLMPPAAVPLTAASLIDISHESLIRNWKQLKAWVEDEANSAATYRRLAETAALYRKGEAGLWRDPDLQLALQWRARVAPNEAWARRYHLEFALAMDFLQASRQRQDEEISERQRAQQERLEQAEALAAAQRQRLEEQAKLTMQRRFLAALVIVALLALLAAGFAFSAYRLANGLKQYANSLAYVANLNLAGSEFERGNHQRGYELLDEYLPVNNGAQKQEDVRSFYWYYLWHQNFNELATLSGHESVVYSVAFAPDGRTLASASRDKTVKLWDVASRQELATLSGHGAEVFWVAFAPDGRMLASASEDKLVKLWDVASRQELATLSGHESVVYSVAFAPDGRMLASASGDKTIKLWDVASRKELATLSGHGAEVWSVAFAPDGRTLASASGDKMIKLWDVASRKELATLSGHESVVYSVAFAPDGRTLASASGDNSVRLWEGAKDEQVARQRNK